jgi:hypothetical protein
MTYENGYLVLEKKEEKPISTLPSLGSEDPRGLQKENPFDLMGTEPNPDEVVESIDANSETDLELGSNINSYAGLDDLVADELIVKGYGPQMKIIEEYESGLSNDRDQYLEALRDIASATGGPGSKSISDDRKNELKSLRTRNTQYSSLDTLKKFCK